MKKKIIVFGIAMMCLSEITRAEETPDTLTQTLQEVIVTGQSARQRQSTVTPGVERVELSKMSSLPVVFGENDLIKSIALLPGVSNEREGAGGFEVHGGNASQNLVQLDGITLYNPAHVMGIFSTFNDNALASATLYKGPVPAFYGGATSSVLETTLTRGNMERYHGCATVGILMAKIMAQGPIVKNRLSFAVAARRSYVDAFLKMVPKYRSTVMNFYDVSGKLTYIPRRGDYLDVSFFASHDNMAISDIMGMYWGNIGASVNWLTRRGERWMLTTTGAVSSYDPDMRMSIMRTDQRLTEYIRDYAVNERVDYRIDEDNAINFGVRSELLRVKSGDMRINGNRLVEIRSGWENDLWLNYEGRVGSRLDLAAGVRLGLFSALSSDHFHKFESLTGENPNFGSKTYFVPQPRISLKYDVAPFHSVKTGVSLSTQNIHAIRSTETSFPFDRYALTSREVRPEKSWQFVVGYNGMTDSGSFDWSVEAYYKTMRNVYDYDDGRTMFSEIDLESIISGGSGRSYGLELMVRKNVGALTGWLSYTLSKTQTRIPEINDGRWYDASNDRRHNLSATATYKFNNRWQMSAVFSYSSGQPLTVPDVKYEIDGTTCYYFSERNGYRTPASHHLDLSAVYTHEGKKFTYQWAFGIYNLYNHYNPFVVYFTDDSSKPSGTKAVQQSLYGIVPSVSYTLKF